MFERFDSLYQISAIVLVGTESRATIRRVSTGREEEEDKEEESLMSEGKLYYRF